MKKIFVLLLSLVFFISLATADYDFSDLEYVEEDIMTGKSINWTKQVLTVKGNGFGPEHVKELGRRKILAQRAAMQDAYRNVLEAVQGVQLTSSTTVRDLMLESDEIRSRTEGMVRGIKVRNVHYTDEGGCEVTVEINISQDGGFLLTALDNTAISVVDEYPRFDWVALRNELEQTKVELAAKTEQLGKTQRELASTRYALNRTSGELRQIKSEYAALKGDFEKNLAALFSANEKLIRTEEALKYSKLRQEDLDGFLQEARTELAATRTIVDELNRTVQDSRIQAAVSGRELALTREFLQDKKDQADRLYADLSQVSREAVSGALSQARVQGYVEQVRQLQYETGQHLQQYYVQGASPAPAGARTGILIDARGLGAKPVLAPALLSENRQTLYGARCGLNLAGGGPLADYLSGDLNRAKNYNRIGNDPLVVKAVGLERDSDFIIAGSDVKALANYMDLLEKKKVAILL